MTDVLCPQVCIERIISRMFFFFSESAFIITTEDAPLGLYPSSVAVPTAALNQPDVAARLHLCFLDWKQVEEGEQSFFIG